MISVNRASLKDRVVFGFWGYQIIIYLLASVVIFFFISFFLFAYSPLQKFLPQNVSLKRGGTLELIMAVDSLEQDLLTKSLYIQALRSVLSGGDLDSILSAGHEQPKSFKDLDLAPSKEDSLLRDWVQKEDSYNIPESYVLSSARLEDFVFFKPIDGFVIDSFNVSEKHFGVDIAAHTNSPVKATLDGVVVFAEWSYESGHVLIIQHTENIVSVYMHNSSISKERNELVLSGEVVGVVGNSGESSSGPHLHFELWQNGSPINPIDYIDF